MRAETADVAPAEGFVASSGCEACGHSREGRPGSVIGNRIRQALGLRLDPARCATFDRNAGMQDHNYCPCAALAHSETLLPDRLTHIEVDHL